MSTPSQSSEREETVRALRRVMDEHRLTATGRGEWACACSPGWQTSSRSLHLAEAVAASEPWQNLMAEREELRTELSAAEEAIDDKSRIGHAVAAGWEQAAAQAIRERDEAREWQREVCDLLGYDADAADQAAEVLTYLPAWRAQAAADRDEVEQLRAAVARVEALCDDALSIQGAGEVLVADVLAALSGGAGEQDKAVCHNCLGIDPATCLVCDGSGTEDEAEEGGDGR